MNTDYGEKLTFDVPVENWESVQTAIAFLRSPSSKPQGYSDGTRIPDKALADLDAVASKLQYEEFVTPESLVYIPALGVVSLDWKLAGHRSLKVISGAGRVGLSAHHKSGSGFGFGIEPAREAVRSCGVAFYIDESACSDERHG